MRGRFVHREQHLAPRFAQPRPAPIEDSLADGGVAAAEPIGSDQRRARKHRRDLRVNGVIGLGVERQLVHASGQMRLLVIGVHRNEDRRVPRMRQTPGPDDLQAVDKGETRRAEIDVLDVKDLQTRFRHGGHVVRRHRLPAHLQPGRVREPAPIGVIGQVKLQGPRAVVELLDQRRMVIVESERRLRRGGLQQRHQGRGDRLLVAVVSAHREDVVHPQIAVHPALRAASTGPRGVRRLQIAGWRRSRRGGGQKGQEPRRRPAPHRSRTAMAVAASWRVLELSVDATPVPIPVRLRLKTP